MGEVIPFPRDVVSTQIGELCASGMEIMVHVREDDDDGGRLVVDAAIFQPHSDMPIPARFHPLLVTMTPGRGGAVGWPADRSRRPRAVKSAAYPRPQTWPAGWADVCTTINPIHAPR